MSSSTRPVETAPAYLDPTLPIPDRVADLITRMTLSEKVSQMCNACPAIPRLGIPAYDYWNEALHGVARNGRATVFPQAIAMAAVWDAEMVQQIADAISTEGRAKYHAAMRRNGGAGIYQGLTFWSPNVNIFRDARWGRGQETWGEDPYLTGELGAAFVRGLQGDHPRYLKSAACAKHYAVHSGPEKDRHVYDACPTQHDLYDTYLPAFKKLVVEARVEAVMGAYNRVFGEPACASRLLLDDILREQWGFEGHVVSDCGAINDFHNWHKVTSDPAESAAMAVKTGCDMSCICTYEHLEEAVQRGLISEAEIERSLARTLTTRFKLGMFDPQEQVPFASTPLDVVNSPAHRRLAYEAALKSAVLLKNKAGVLPIRPDVRSILVTGPTAANVNILLGNYHGLSETLTTLLQGIAASAPEGIKIEYRPGCQLVTPNKNQFDWLEFEAAASDLTIACVGLAPQLEGEEGDAILSEENGDRTDIRLPRVQVDFIRKLSLAGARIVLVVTGGSPIALTEIEDLVEAILFVWYPGQEGGQAAADLLFGKASPSGKLPLTFPKSIEQLPAFDDYSMANRTYRYAAWEPLYPFGFGLSYTQFGYRDLALERDALAPGEPLKARVTVENTGSLASDEVVQVYLTALAPGFPAPLASLVGFRRVHLQPGEAQDLQFEIAPEQMLLVDESGQQVRVTGAYRLTAGGCSPSGRAAALGAPEPQSLEFSLV